MTLPPQIESRLKTWDSSSIMYMIVGAIFIAIGVLASTAVAAFTDQLAEKNLIKWFGFGAAVCTALIAAFNPLSLGFAFRDAWRALDSAVLHHIANPTDYPIRTVIDAIDKGEIIISAASKALVKFPDTQLNSFKA